MSKRRKLLVLMLAAGLATLVALATAPRWGARLLERALAGYFHRQVKIERLALRLGEFRKSVRETLIASSSAFAILDQLADSGLKDCAKCTRELEARLAGNPHYIVHGELYDAEQVLAKLGHSAR